MHHLDAVEDSWLHGSASCALEDYHDVLAAAQAASERADQAPYRRRDDFLAARDRLDPHRMFGNAYTEQVFGR